MLQPRLAQRPADDLSDSRVAVGLVVEVLDVGLGVVPALLQRAVADDVAVVRLEVAQCAHALGVVGQDLGLGVHGDLVGRDLLLAQVIPR